LLSRIADQLVPILHAVLHRHGKTLKFSLVLLWVVGAVLALMLAGVLLGGELILYGFRDCPPPG
jgi:hypothetical protein